MITNQEEPITEPISFRDELERHVINSGMSYRQIAGESYVQLHRALRGGRVDPENLINWCWTLIQSGKLSRSDASRLMNLAGFATPEQQQKAAMETTKQRAIVKKCTEHSP